MVNIKHDNLSEEDWDRVRNLRIDEAEMTKVWDGEDGKLHIEITYESHDFGEAYEEFLFGDLRKSAAVVDPVDAVREIRKQMRKERLRED